MADAPELASALDALDALLVVRLEERKAAGTIDLLSGRVAFTGRDRIPKRSTYLGDGPLAKLCDHLPLSDIELLLLVAALAPYVDERYARLLASLSDRPGADGVTGEALRNLCGRTRLGRQKATTALAPDGPLRGLQLIEVEPSEEGPLAGRVRVPDDILTGLVGAPPVAPQLSPEFPASPLHTVHGVEDLVVPRATKQRIRDVLDRLASRPTVLGEWGIGGHHDGVEGLTVMLHGPPGTGKTMTAAVLAKKAGLLALRVDLSTLVSKYIGETAKNLESVFRFAERNPCLLFFDEADAVFGKRGDVSDARDRYANQEISYLLQRIETFPGVVVLATNLLANIDAAFTRRIDVMIEMVAPDKRLRRQLWERAYPAAVPVDDVDFAELATRYELTGAQIRDAAIEAAYQAASNGGVVTTDHLEAAVAHQFAKSGLMLPARS